MGPYAGVDYNLTLCPLQSRPQHIYHGQPYARADYIPLKGLCILPLLYGTELLRPFKLDNIILALYHAYHTIKISRIF
jgi:hypothetical protein